MNNKNNFKIIPVKVHKDKIYFEPYFEQLAERLNIAKKIAKKDKETAILIIIANLEGMAVALEHRDRRKIRPFKLRFTKFLEKFCTLSYLDTDQKRKYLWSIFRCSLAHTGMVNYLFIDSTNHEVPIEETFIGNLSVKKNKILENLDGTFYQFPINCIFDIYDTCLNNFRNHIKSNSRDFTKEYFILKIIKCSNKISKGNDKECGFCYPKSFGSCPFCKEPIPDNQ